MAARLAQQKGHRFLVEAVPKVRDAIFILAGDGPERDALEEQVRLLAVEDRVRFLGYRSDIPELLANSDALVLPSLYEGLPLAVLEAMAAGKPVVATSVGGTDEAVVDGETGFLVPPRDSDALAAAIRRVIQDDVLAQRLGANGRARVAAHFRVEAMVQQVAGVYDEVLGDDCRRVDGRRQA
jgi:glycosyltransferase involved in cell wall biosynthesis